MEEANRSTLAIAQIESQSAIHAIEKIARVEGIDVLLIGPNDLAASLGKPGDLTCAEVSDAIARVGEAAAENGKIFAMHAGINLLNIWVPKGMRLFLNSLDLGALTKVLGEIADQNRNLINGEST
jgi:2-keto-3-deoxy-L-rhamnonate aldolase RhmA